MANMAFSGPIRYKLYRSVSPKSDTELQNPEQNGLNTACWICEYGDFLVSLFLMLCCAEAKLSVFYRLQIKGSNPLDE